MKMTLRNNVVYKGFLYTTGSEIEVDAGDVEELKQYAEAVQQPEEPQPEPEKKARKKKGE